MKFLRYDTSFEQVTFRV